MARQLTRIRAGLRHGKLDAALAAGQDPWSAGDLMLRASALSSLAMQTRLENGQVLALGREIPVVIRFQPLWLRLLLASVPILAVIGAVRGRRLPGWHLVPCDENGRPIPSKEPVRLKVFRKRLLLDRFGLPGASIRRSLILGKTEILLSGPTTHRPGGLREFTGNSGRRPLNLGDVLSSSEQGGSKNTYRIEAF